MFAYILGLEICVYNSWNVFVFGFPSFVHLYPTPSQLMCVGVIISACGR